MSLFIASLNSGSNGNCYYIGTEREAVLVDAGISCRETEKRMQQLELPMQRVKAVFISHEHTDHIRGVTILAKKYQLPVYITPKTLRNSRLNLAEHLVVPFCATEPVQIGPMTITAFPKFHDAADPHSFSVTCSGVRVGIFTDIGVVCEQLAAHFSQCQAAFLEANYDEEMLHQGRYPYYLKKRISGGRGHLSNKQALELFTSGKPDNMSHLLLSHLSQENNCPTLVQNLFQAHAGHTEIIVASRLEATPVFRIGTPLQEQRMQPSTGKRYSGTPLIKDASLIQQKQASLFPG
jgi:phosphoribosyl 1,2-cyclic phosphodiesterase